MNDSNAIRGLAERTLIGILSLTLRAFLLVMRKSRTQGRIAKDGPLTVLLTGTFYSSNWANAHLVPLSESTRGGQVIVVSTFPLAARPGITVVIPPKWLRQLCGDVGARLCIYYWRAVRDPPDLVGGFHLLFNGMAAAVVGRLVGACSLYFCVGGEAEIVGGGVNSENRIFGRLSAPHAGLQALLQKVVTHFDLIVTMGTRAAAYFESVGVPGIVVVNGGGLDPAKFAVRAPSEDQIDLLFVGRLAAIKRVDRILVAVKLLTSSRYLRVVIVGDGPLAENLREKVSTLGLTGIVSFVGSQNDVLSYLRKSRVFILTSESEGVSLAVLEAMMAGVVPVVSDVGDLRDAIEDGVSGFLVGDQRPESFAGRVSMLLEDHALLSMMSRAAQESAERYSVTASAAKWKASFNLLAVGNAAEPEPGTGKGG